MGMSKMVRPRRHPCHSQPLCLQHQLQALEIDAAMACHLAMNQQRLIVTLRDSVSPQRQIVRATAMVSSARTVRMHLFDSYVQGDELLGLITLGKFFFSLL